MEQRMHLEPIQEEPELENGFKGSKTGEGEQDFQIQVGMETEEVMAEDESEEEDDAVLRVMRPGRRSRSFSRESFLQMQSSDNQQEEVENFSVSNEGTHAVDLSVKATPLRWRKLGKNKWSRILELRKKVSEIRLQKHTPHKPSVQQRTNRTRPKKSLDEELFPQWLVDLMVNIEEATAHQLVVE
ncbi:uncharacterized protein LOC120799288 isoform X2 [Lates japonicus]